MCRTAIKDREGQEELFHEPIFFLKLSILLVRVVPQYSLRLPILLEFCRLLPSISVFHSDLCNFWEPE